MKDRNVVIVTLIITLVFASILIILQRSITPTPYNPRYSSDISFWAGGMMGTMMSTQGEKVSVSQAIQMMGNVPQYAKVIESNDTIVFKESDINLIVIAAGHEELSNMASNAPPSYAKDDVFVIYGLVNPTLVVPNGAKLKITIVNLDKEMYHNFVFTSSGPPYPYMVVQHRIMDGFEGGWIMMPFLPPAIGDEVAHAYSYTITVPAAGSFWYLCTYPGHAQNGMYGSMLIAG